MHHAIEAFVRRRPNFLSTSEWIELPFAMKPKSWLHRLIDIFLMGPEILRKAGEVEAAPGEQPLTLSLQLFREPWAVDRLLHGFSHDLESSPGAPLYWKQAASGNKMDDSHRSDRPGIREVAIWHQDIETSIMFIFFWSMLTMVWSGLTDTYSGLCASGAGPILEVMAP